MFQRFTLRIRFSTSEQIGQRGRTPMKSFRQMDRKDTENRKPLGDSPPNHGKLAVREPVPALPEIQQSPAPPRPP